jgi:hypothetical protein
MVGAAAVAQLYGGVSRYSYLGGMTEIRTVTTLQHKRDKIASAIANYEKKLAQARADLAHIAATISIFEASGNLKGLPAYVDLHRAFKYGEVFELASRPWK